ncbi:MAG TPA: membrane protein insertase YidC [Frankiaceae bacterium]|nr:membrane protein insertase YidC [Frankiaceae bacterium]
MGDLFRALLSGIAQAIVGLHNLTSSVFGDDSGVSWGLAIVLLTICIRLLMYPLFVKQIRTQRAMQALQPKIKELQAKHKGDKETLNAEMMKLYKEHGANPFAGCLPVLLQMPVFIALYQVLHQLGPRLRNGEYTFHEEKFGLSRDTIESFMSAKIFGAPIGAGFQSNDKLLGFLDASPGAVKVVAVALIVVMAATTFFTSKQMMGRNPNADASQATQQKILLYVMPAMLGLFGFQVAIGVLVYWTTTNVFSMVQQAVVMKRLGPPDATPPKAKGAAPAAGRKPANAPAGPPRPPKGAKAAVPPRPATPAGEAAANGAAADGSPVAAAKRPANRNAKNRGKGQRRGGRR